MSKKKPSKLEAARELLRRRDGISDRGGELPSGVKELIKRGEAERSRHGHYSHHKLRKKSGKYHTMIRLKGEGEEPLPNPVIP